MPGQPASGPPGSTGRRSFGQILEQVSSRTGIWFNQVFNWWAFVLTLVVFLPLGFAAGYSVREPTLVMASAKELLGVSSELRTFLLQAEIPQPHDIDDGARRLADAALATQEAMARLPPSARDRLGRPVGALLASADDIRKALRRQDISYDRALNSNLAKLDRIYSRERTQIEDSTNWQSIAYDQIKRFLKWIGAISFLTIVSATLFLLALTNPRIRKLVAKTGSISAFGMSLNFSDLQSVRASIRVRQDEIETDVKAAYTSALRSSRLQPAFGQVVRDIQENFKKAQVDLQAVNHRMTLFIPGFVGQELVQATRYCGTWRIGDETVIGRRFSVRYGIIGKAWRLRTCQYYPEIRNLNHSLIREWGFTAEEANPYEQARSGAPSGSLMAFPIKDIGDAPPLGVIYIEAEGGGQLHPHDGEPLSPHCLVADGSGMTTADRFAQDRIWSRLDPQLLDRLKLQLSRLQTMLRWNDKLQEGAGR